MLKLLQSGVQPLGQFDMLDGSVLVGGEVGILQASPVGDASADGTSVGQPKVAGVVTQVAPGEGLLSALHGFLDEGIKGYGTLFGDIIGMTAGQGTGFGAQFAKGVVHVGPQTTAGSGKATLWTNPGLYGVTSDAWTLPAEQAAAALNAPLYGTALTGKLTTTPSVTAGAVPVALAVGTVQDRSLVSTTNGVAAPEFLAVFLLGPQA